MATATRLQRAKFWQYTGNSLSGKDCSRQNPYGYKLGLISWMVYQKEWNAANNVQVRYGKKDSFGREVEVAATKELWDKAYLDFAKEIGEDLEVCWGKLTVKQEDGCKWLCSPADDRVVCELFDRAEDETELEFIKKGYAFVDLNGQRYFFETDRL